MSTADMLHFSPDQVAYVLNTQKIRSATRTPYFNCFSVHAFMVEIILWLSPSLYDENTVSLAGQDAEEGRVSIRTAESSA